MKLRTYLTLLILAVVVAFLLGCFAACVPLSKHRRMIAVRDTINQGALDRASDAETQALALGKQLAECQAESARQSAILRKFNQTNEDGILWKDQTR